jgi:hypothetical protein
MPNKGKGKEMIPKKEMNMRKLLFGMLLAPMAFGSNIALADGWPASVVGHWDVSGNGSRGTLNITSQGSTGDCRLIAGTIYGTSTIQGYYCPLSGRILFRRKLPGTTTEFQDWAGNLSQQPVDGKSIMRGVFSSNLGQFREINWQASLYVPGCGAACR